MKQLNFGTQKGSYGDGEGLPPTGRLDALDMEVGDDNRVEILVSCEAPESGNWLPMEPESNLLIIRQTLVDRETESIAELRIERVDAEAVPEPLTAGAARGGGCKDASKLVAGASLLFAKWATRLSKALE